MTDAKMIKKTAAELLKKIGIEAEIEVIENETPEIVIETEEAGILIGFHGENLRSLELILSLLVSSRLGVFTRVNVDVGGYKKQHEEKLFAWAEKIKEQVKVAGKPQFFPNLAPSERRLIHLFFQEDKEVTTESQGEGENRQLVIKPR